MIMAMVIHAALLAAGILASCGTPLSDAPGASEEIPGTVAAEVRVEALELARSKEGAPYEWAADGPDAFDCSGLIVWAYQEALGESSIFRGPDGRQDDITMDGLHRHGTEEIAPEELQPGDIVFITSEPDEMTHGGVFIQWISDLELEFINASSYHDAVVIDTWPVGSTKRGQWFAGAGRVRVPE